MKYGLILLLLCAYVQASTIAVIDSGVDVEHKDLLANLWLNPSEIADNGRDEDGNGYQDDVYGWNFAENNNLVIDRKYVGTFSADPYLFFEIQGKMFLGTATDAEKQWVTDKRSDADFVKEMGIFGNFVHGTHVAGITADGNPEAKILSVKLIPTEVKPFVANMINALSAKSDEDLRMKILKATLGGLAKQQMLMMEEIAVFINGHKADIANGSFGTGYGQAKTITDALFKVAYQRDPNEEESNELVQHFLGAMISEGSNMVASAPNTLFVFAAGNDGSNNDVYPTSPTNIQADNVISVGATYKYDFLAPFSNYGEKMVDVAAPGMLIHSTIPGDEYLDVSGTSQAAPYVANVAARIKDINPSLTPKEIKEIIMGTVDEKAYLVSKIKTKGIVNMDRAAFAANLSLTNTVSQSINRASSEVADVKSLNLKTNYKFSEAFVLPLTSVFK